MKVIKYKDKKTNKTLWRWSGYIGIDPITQKQKNGNRRGFATKLEALQDFEACQRRLLTGYGVNIQAMTLKELITEYYDYKKERVKPITLHGYRRVFTALKNLNMLPLNSKVSSISRLYAQKVADTLQEHYQTDTAKLYINIMASLFNYAVKMNIIDLSPFKGVTLKKKEDKKKKENFLESSQIPQLLDAIKEEDNMQVYTFVFLLVYTGMRQGEARALSWSDVDFFNNTISITKTVTRDENDREKVGTTPKTKESNRTIFISKAVAKTLRTWQNEQRATFLKRGMRLNDNALIFSNLNGDIISPTVIRYHFDKAIKAHNLTRVTLHGLRHTYISLMIELGEQPINVAHNVGHSSLDMIMSVYDAMTTERKRKSADIIDAFITKI